MRDSTLVRLDKKSRDELRKIAEGNHRSMQGQIQFWIDEAKKARRRNKPESPAQSGS